MRKFFARVSGLPTVRQLEMEAFYIAAKSRGVTGVPANEAATDAMLEELEEAAFIERHGDGWRSTLLCGRLNIEQTGEALRAWRRLKREREVRG